MDYVIISAAALAVSALTLFSGFGLGTLLMPVMAIFFPPEEAIALTAIVHLLNNIFKLILLGKYSNKTVLLKFGLPAVIFAAAGAFLLNYLSFLTPLASYSVFGGNYEILPVKLIMGLLILAFVFIEILTNSKNYSFKKKHLLIGGAFSGFFGGLSGHQGALRSAFLAKANLTKEQFIGTGVVIACMVDVTRISVYSTHFSASGITDNIMLLIAATVSGFAGIYIGTKFLKKVTMKTVQAIVSMMLIVIGILLAAGIV